MSYSYNPANQAYNPKPYSPYSQGYYANPGYRPGIPMQPNPYAYPGRPPMVIVPTPPSQRISSSSNFLWQGAAFLGLGALAIVAFFSLGKGSKSPSPSATESPSSTTSSGEKAPIISPADLSPKALSDAKPPTELTVEQARQMSPEQQIEALKALFEQQTRGEIPSDHAILVELRDQLQPDYGDMLMELGHLERIQRVKEQGLASHPSQDYQEKWKPFEEAGLLTEILDLESFKSAYRLQHNPAFQSLPLPDRQKRLSAGEVPLLRNSITTQRDKLQARQDNQSLLYTLGGFWRDNTLAPLNPQEQDLLRRLNKWLDRYPARPQTHSTETA